MKVKFYIDANCPECGTKMLISNHEGKSVIRCYSNNCPNRHKYYELPEIDIKEFKDGN